MFLNYEDKYIRNKKLNQNIITYGANNKNLNYTCQQITSSEKGILFEIKTKDIKVQFRSQLIGKHNALNLTAAISVSNYLKIPIKKLQYPIQQIKSVKHRLQVIQRENLTIIDNSYNSNPVSSKNALDTLSQFTGPKAIITPGLIELGREQRKYNIEFGQNIVPICNYIFLVKSSSHKYVLQGIKAKRKNDKNIFVVDSPQQAINEITKLTKNKKITILIENDLPDNHNK